ncbi:MAG: hypothetical protein V4719_12365 [Planctomycetota bacterium]
MQSIPQALIWETLAHGRWGLIIGVLGANFVPLLLFSALTQSGPIDTADSSYVIMCVVLTQIHLFTFGTAVISAQGQPSRLYSAPVPNATLAIWHLLPAMVLVATETVLSTVLLNALFGLNWPLWGPALFVAAALPAVQATIWQTDKSFWLIPVMGTVAAILGVWYKSRFGPLFSLPTHLWTTVTPGEIITLAIIAGASCYAAIGGIARRRRGDVLQSPGILAWFARLFDQPATTDQSFRTPAQAQFWSEWRQKGWMMPACVAIGLVGGIGIWTIAIREPQHLLEGFLSGGGLLCLLAFVCSMILGNTGSSDADFEMCQFLASRPVTTKELSRTILKVISHSVLLSWLIWAISFLVFYLITLAAGVTLQPTIPVHLLWLYFPATLVGLWIMTTTGASIVLTGRRWLGAGVIFGGIACIFVFSLFSEYALEVEERPRMARLAGEAIGVALVLGAVWALATARRRGLISWSTIYLASSVWIVLSAYFVVFKSNVPGNLPPVLLGIGLLALAVAPFATAPLALAWNRNR